MFWEPISNARKSVLSDFQAPRSSVFIKLEETLFLVFDILHNHRDATTTSMTMENLIFVHTMTITWYVMVIELRGVQFGLKSQV